MSDTYTKLFSSITASTIVSEPVATRWAWVTMLAAVKSDGCVYGSIPGLARLANLTIEEIEAALACFMGPDPYSRTPDNDGRRIEKIDGGWRLLNHEKYDNTRNMAERSAYKREWDRKHRPSGYARQSDKQSDSPTHSPTKPDSPAPSASASASAKSKSNNLARQAARFDEFLAVYPNKNGKSLALAKWQARGLDAIADLIIADVKARKTSDREWLSGYVPHVKTYVNQSRWEDGIVTDLNLRGGEASADAQSLAR